MKTTQRKNRCRHNSFEKKELNWWSNTGHDPGTLLESHSFGPVDYGINYPTTYRTKGCEHWTSRGGSTRMQRSRSFETGNCISHFRYPPENDPIIRSNCFPLFHWVAQWTPDLSMGPIVCDWTKVFPYCFRIPTPKGWVSFAKCKY